MLKQIFIVSTALMFFALSPARGADPLPEPEELKKLYTDGKYQELIPKLNKVLAIKGGDASLYNRYDLLAMKGDSSLHTHSKSSAADAFRLAGAAATTPEDAATAMATSILITQSAGTLKYLPKARASKDDKPDPIDIVDPDSRKKALEALETDMTASLKIKIDAVVKGSSLPAVVKMVKDKDLADLKTVELAATGSNADTKQMLGDLGAHASSLMDAALDKMDDDIKADVKAVNNRLGNDAPAKPGDPPEKVLTISQFQQALTTINDNAKAIQDYAVNMKGMFGDGTDLKPLVDRSTQIQVEAKNLLKQAKKAGG